MQYFIANWKANKNLEQALSWITGFLSLKRKNRGEKIIICPPYPLLYPLKEKIKSSVNIFLGSQDLSAHESGTFTGEVTAETLSGLVNYAIVGHSERKKNFSENEKTDWDKISLALKYEINPLLCLQNEKAILPDQVKFVVYEPPWAISKGFKDSLNTKIEEPPAKVVEVKNKLNLADDKIYIYGGSVNPQNIREYSKFPEINGVLVGGASLDPEVFNQIVNTA